MRLKDIEGSGFETWVEERDTWDNPKCREFKNKVPFYDTKEWRRLRAKVLQRYGHECMKCGRVPLCPEVDHIKSRFYHPHLALEFDNLQVLCARCNDDKGISYADYRPISR